jgi:hypothetical protein
MEFYIFLILLNHIITPVMGKVAPNKQTMKPRILDGSPQMELMCTGLKVALTLWPRGLSAKATSFKCSPLYWS